MARDRQEAFDPGLVDNDAYQALHKGLRPRRRITVVPIDNDDQPSSPGDR